MYQFTINGVPYSEGENALTLPQYLRTKLGLTATKTPCDEGDCGGCLVLVFRSVDDGKLRGQSENSCLLRLADIHGSAVITLEGLTPKDGESSNPLQALAVKSHISQCGFCTPGLMIALTDWLLNGETMDVKEGQHRINGNLCRCTGYMAQNRLIAQISETFQTTHPQNKSRLEQLQKIGVLPEIKMPAIVSQPNPQDSQKQKISLAGGTDLTLSRKVQASSPLTTLDYETIPVLDLINQGCTLDETNIIINAKSPLNNVAISLGLALGNDHPCVKSFQKMVDYFASHSIRNRATLGGNLANGSPAADGAVWLLAMDARLKTNLRSIALNDFYTGYKQNCLHSGEVIEHLMISLDKANHISRFEKVSRRPHTDISVVSAALNLSLVDEKISDISLAMGCIGPFPKRLYQCEDLLKGLSTHELNSEKTQQQLEKILQTEISPISDKRGSAQYRRLLARQILLTLLRIEMPSPSFLSETRTDV